MYQFLQTAHLIPIKNHDSPMIANADLDSVWKHHGFPEDVVSDRNGTFTKQYFSYLNNLLGISCSMITAFHPQTDGQTEQIDKETEAYSRSYCNNEQTNWSSMLAMAEYACNTWKHEATKISPSHANYGFQPRMNWPTNNVIGNPASELYGHGMALVHSNVSGQLR